MKLWKISQAKKNDYVPYDSVIVAAETEAEAMKKISLDGKDIKPKSFNYWGDDLSDVICEYVGEAKDGTQKGVVCVSFNSR